MGNCCKNETTKVKMLQSALNSTNSISFRFKFRTYRDVKNCLMRVWANETDLCLIEISDRTTENTILPFTIGQYGIYYKINEFHVSSTFFIEGMSHDLWMFSFITLFLIFVGFLISTKLYCHYLKRSWLISDVFIYQANFWCNQTVFSYLDNFLSWRIQLINATMFNIILMTAFSAKFVGLMSIRHFEQPFNSLEDFTTLKTHSLCISPLLIPMKYFLQHNNVNGNVHGISPKWKEILNPPLCAPSFKDFHEEICKHDKVAIVYPNHQYYREYINCPVYELTEFFPNAYGTIMLSKRIKQKEKLNQAYIKMREVGIVDRMSKKYGMKKDPLKNFQASYNDKYKVHIEGVMFEHVKIFVIGYFMFLTIPLIILLMEIMIHKYMNRI